MRSPPPPTAPSVPSSTNDDDEEVIVVERDRRHRGDEVEALAFVSTLRTAQVGDRISPTRGYTTETLNAPADITWTGVVEGAWHDRFGSIAVLWDPNKQNLGRKRRRALPEARLPDPDVVGIQPPPLLRNQMTLTGRSWPNHHRQRCTQTPRAGRTRGRPAPATGTPIQTNPLMCPCWRETQCPS